MLMNLIPVVVMLCFMLLKSNIVLFRCMNLLESVYVDELDPSDGHGALDVFAE